MKLQNKKRYTIKNYVLAFILIVAFIFVVLCIFKCVSSNTPVAEYEKVWNILQNDGYSPQELSSNETYVKNMTVNDERLYFEFNVFQSTSIASEYWSKTHSKIIEKEYYPDKGYYSANGNYVIYSTTVSDVNYVGIRVGNTTVFAYCNKEYQKELNSILMSIGYLNQSQLGKTLSQRSRNIINIFLYLIVLLPLSWLSTKHMRVSILNNAELSCEKIKSLRTDSKNVFSYKLKLFKLITHSTKKAKKLIFAYALMYLPVILLIITETVSMLRNEHILFADYLGIIAIIIILFNFSLKSNLSKKLIFCD